MSFNEPTSYEWLMCFTCGMEFAIPTHWFNHQAEKDEDIFCPNGHRNGYQSPKAEKEETDLKEQNAKLRRQLTQQIHDHDEALARARVDVLAGLDCGDGMVDRDSTPETYEWSRGIKLKGAPDPELDHPHKPHPSSSASSDKCLNDMLDRLRGKAA